MKQSKTLHGARLVASLGGKVVCHLREFGICDFEVVDRFPAELLVANTRDVRGNPLEWVNGQAINLGGLASSGFSGL